jgi:peptidoglycan L-alanyl-D-glutamate endopeptidase CwlK
MRGLHLLHPAVRTRAEALISRCNVLGLPVLITDTFRTAEEQDGLYAQGRTKPGPIVTNARGTDYRSTHQWGVAFDFCKNVKGQEYSDTAFFRHVGILGKSVGLFWGGDFKGFTDMPHFEDPVFAPANSTAALIKQYGVPEKFIATMRVLLR